MRNLRKHMQQLRTKSSPTVNSPRFLFRALQKPRIQPVSVLEFQRRYWLSKDSNKRSPIGISHSSFTALNVLVFPVPVTRICIIQDLLCDICSILPTRYPILRSAQLPIHQLEISVSSEWTCSGLTYIVYEEQYDRANQTVVLTCSLEGGLSEILA